MNKKDLAEIKKTIIRDGYTFDRFTACTFNESREMSEITSGMFGSLPEEEIDRYLDIAKKTLSGSIGKCLINADITNEEAESFTLLNKIKETGLKDEEAVRAFFSSIGEHYHEEIEAGYFAVIILHGMYGILGKTEDIEGEDVYDHLIVSICPLTLQKPSLGIEDKKIAELTRKWQIGAPTEGFLYPAFEERQTDIHKMLIFMKKEFDSTLMKEVMCIDPDSLAPADKQTEFISDTLNEISLDNATSLAENVAAEGDEELSKSDIKDLLSRSGIEVGDDFDKVFDEELGSSAKVSKSNLPLSKDAMIKIGDFTIKGSAAELSKLCIRSGHLLLPIEGDMQVNGIALSSKGTA